MNPYIVVINSVALGIASVGIILLARYAAEMRKERDWWKNLYQIASRERTGLRGEVSKLHAYAERLERAIAEASRP